MDDIAIKVLDDCSRRILELMNRTHAPVVMLKWVPGTTVVLDRSTTLMFVDARARHE
jgi:hypothetical protein